jgi:3-hydroxybutyryl-CoA dehydrogenase
MQQYSGVGMSSRKKVGVVGAGAMGRGVIQLFAQSDHDVYFYDAGQGAVQEANRFVLGMLSRMVEKGRLSAEKGKAASSRLHPCETLEGLKSCDLVIEAIVENIDIKQKVFAELEALVSPSCMLTSNTSSLLIAEIAAKCLYPDRVAGLHFFNPVPLMKVVEVISAVKTSEATVNALTSIIATTGHRAVVATDQPGFLVNHAGRGLYTEGLRIVEEHVASPADVDVVLRDAAGFKMGPFELMDLTGLDVSGKVMESIFSQFFQEPRFRPSPLVSPRIAAGLFGRKSKKGWYAYDQDGKKISSVLETPVTKVHDFSVWIEPTATQYHELCQQVRSAGGRLSDSADTEGTLIVVQPWGLDISEVCAREGFAAHRTVGIDPLTPEGKRHTLMLSPLTSKLMKDNAIALFSSSQQAITVIDDSPGFILQRVLATIVNIATNIAQQGIATVEDIEDAVILGLGYPKGPLSWGDEIGGQRILDILQNMYAITGDPRYRPSLWLRRRVQLNVSIKTKIASKS